MKHNKNLNNAVNPEAKLKPIRFEFKHPTAATVCVAGCFNQWNPTTKPMDQLGKGFWFKETALSPGTYEYCLVVDGLWMPDPAAKETVRNPYGGKNSILRVASSPEARHLTDAENLPIKNANQPEGMKL
jgi:1,4-alpha-glucan branching enzyme